MDLISRQAAIEALKALEEPAPTARHLSAIFDCQDAIKTLPSEQSEIIRCEDCKNIWRSGTTTIKEVPTKIYKCKLWNNRAVSEKGFCYMAERRTDE